MMYDFIATMVRKSKRMNVVQRQAQYTNGDCANSEQYLPSRDPMFETHELEDNEDHGYHRDDNQDNMADMILTKKYKQFS